MSFFVFKIYFELLTSEIRPRRFSSFHGRFGVGEVESSGARNREQDEWGSGGNKESCPALYHNSMLLLESKTAPSS